MHAMISHLQDEGVLYMPRRASQIDLLAHLARNALLAEGVFAADVDKQLFVIAPKKPDPYFCGLLVFRAPPSTSPVPNVFLDAARLKIELPPPATHLVCPPTVLHFFIA
ncbi:MAG: hypothetical protein GY822_21055 [Deltaproteobacteria bacterium]|nr:hypothetical protein [Deltaproteobacteria bacterium]